MKQIRRVNLRKVISATIACCVGPAVTLCHGGSPGTATSQTSAFDYSEPKLLVGNIFPLAQDSKKLLFKSERKSAKTGTTVQVTCDYTYPDGSLVARDWIVYEAGHLVSFAENEFQTGEKGKAVIRPDAQSPGKQRIYFEYTCGQVAEVKTSTSSEELQSETLVDDMIPQFIAAHWEALEQGSAVKFRYIVLSRKETVGFKLVKDEEMIWRGQRAVRIKMVPTSIIIAQLVDPLLFTVEKTKAHRVLEYSGRTTPLLKNGNKWKELDALCVFEAAK
jgi:hypothetical protein